VIAYAAVFMSRIAPTPNISQKSFWLSAFVSAVSAREIASHLTRKGLGTFDPATAFLLGLAHDVGMLVLDGHSPQLYKEVIAHSYYNPSALSRHEKDALGLNHGVAGAVLMKVWGFPEAWIMAVAGHSFPARLPKEFQPWADLLLAAESIAFYLGYHNGACQAQKPEIVPELVLQRLQNMHFDHRDCCNLAEQIRQQVERERWSALVADMPN
jgi:HD-like signal output (HDOD) protein